MLEVKALDAGYGRAQVLFQVNLEVNAGEVVGLLGRNGAGKSTTLKAIMGLVPRWAGEIFFDSNNLKNLEPNRVARLGLGYVPEDRRIFTDLTVAENLEVGRQPPRPGAPDWPVKRLLELFPALELLMERRGGTLSGGEQQMLCIARTLAGNPKAVLMDEPSEGLAPVVVDQMAAAVLELKWAGVAVLLAEQNARFTERVADRRYTLERGRIAP